MKKTLKEYKAAIQELPFHHQHTKFRMFAADGWWTVAHWFDLKFGHNNTGEVLDKAKMMLCQLSRITGASFVVCSREGAPLYYVRNGSMLNKDTRYSIKKHKRSLFAGVYAVSRHYGGPEEGGWWYNWYEHLESTGPVKHCRIRPKLDALEAKYSGEKWGDISSVRGGKDIVAFSEKYPGSQATRHRPHYE